jgi:hypothetical protein
MTAGSTEARGQGPIGFTLVIVDVNYGGGMLGSGQPDSSGNFRITLNKPVESGHLIGLSVDLSPEQTQSEELNRKLFEIRGPGYRLVPNLMTVFDSYSVP